MNIYGRLSTKLDRILSESGVVLASSLIARFGALIASIIASQALEIEDLGRVTTYLFGYQTASSVAIGGIGIILTNTIAANKKSPLIAAAYIRSVGQISLLYTLIFSIMFFLVTYYAIEEADLTSLITFSCAVALNIQFQTNQAAHQGFRDFITFAMGNFIFVGSLVIGLSALLLFPNSKVFAFAYLSANALGLLFSRAKLRKMNVDPLPVNMSRNRRRSFLVSIGARSVKLLFTNLFVSPSLFLVSLSLARTASPLETSIFNILMQWRSVIGLVPGAIAQAHLPRLSSRSSTDSKAWKKFFLFYAAAVALSVTLFASGSDLLFWVYPSEIRDTGDAIIWLALASTLGLANAAIGQFFFVQGKYNLNLMSNLFWATILLAQIFLSGTLSASLALTFLAVANFSQFLFFGVAIAMTNLRKRST